ncbi:helix-turn-helix transcriptional regulator [Sphingomonas sp. M1A8_2b]
MNTDDKIVLDIKGVIELTTLSQTTIYDMAKRGEFPKQVRIGPNRVVWRRADVLGWLERKLEAA